MTTPFFLARYRQLYPDLPPYPKGDREVCIRINTLRTDADTVKKQLDGLSIPYAAVAWCESALLIPGKTARDLTGLPLYENGDIYIQSLSSMIPALVLGPTARDRVLDLAAAPGGKTSQMSALMENKGEIVANDIGRRRLYKLNAVLGLLGVGNVSVISLAGQSLWQKFPEAFDKVLLDAPCSMEGGLFPPAKKIRSLSRLQRWLLRSAVSATRPGGSIVYSTCSMAPEENEEVLSWLLQKEAGKVEVTDIGLAVPGAVAGITAWENKQYHPQVSHAVRIPPSPSMEQFFIAHIRKNASTVATSG